MKLSVVLATRNEGANIRSCLESVKHIADEIIIYDEYSIDNTRDIAKSYNARIFKVAHSDNFHITKQKAIAKAKGDWVLQLDADERVSKSLAREILRAVNNKELAVGDKNKIKLFERYQALIEKRDRRIGTSDGDVVAYFIPRLNYFLGEPLRYAGVYPDAVIRLFKNGYGHLPARSVHELLEVNGKVEWLSSDLIHNESPTLNRYIDRNNRYTTLIARDFSEMNLKKNLINFVNYTFLKSLSEFLKLYIRHKGYKDGMRGFMWSMFSAWRFPLAYFKYWTGEYKTT